MGFSKSINQVGSRSALIQSNLIWQRSESRWFKVNWDAAVRSQQVGLGAVVRNAEGSIIEMSSFRVKASLHPSLAEAWAARLGMALIFV